MIMMTVFDVVQGCPSCIWLYSTHIRSQSNYWAEEKVILHSRVWLAQTRGT